MSKVNIYSYDELQPHQEMKLYLSCLVEDTEWFEGFTIELDADRQTATIVFN